MDATLNSAVRCRLVEIESNLILRSEATVRILSGRRARLCGRSDAVAVMYGVARGVRTGHNAAVGALRGELVPRTMGAIFFNGGRLAGNF